MQAPRRTESSTAESGTTVLRPAADGEPLDPPVEVGETDVTEPMVADGTAASTPFMFVACDDRVANPTDAGLER